jgi:CRISPR-associated endonuclease Cas2
MKHHNWLVLYDICDAQRLHAVNKAVSSYGMRVQRSVFESSADAQTIEWLRQRLLTIIDETVDFVVILPLCENDWQKVERYGNVETGQFVTGLFEIL